MTITITTDIVTVTTALEKYENITILHKLWVGARLSRVTVRPTLGTYTQHTCLTSDAQEKLPSTSKLCEE